MVESLASDPGSAAQSVGQLWYNSASNVWKIGKEGSGAWSSGGAVNTSRYRVGQYGIQTACLKYGGTPPMTADAEEYNGTAWTEVSE